MSEEKKPFTVSDRRHFTPEGEARGEAAAEAEPPPAPSRAREGGVEMGPSGAPAEEGGPPVDFTGLLLSLGAQAGALLRPGGEEGDRTAAPDFRGARAIISVLEVLRDKTEGRRTPDEDRVLEGLLYELKMAYVTLRKAAGE